MILNRLFLCTFSESSQVRAEDPFRRDAGDQQRAGRADSQQRL